MSEINRDELVGFILRYTEQKLSYEEVEQMIDAYHQFKEDITGETLFEKDVEGIGTVKITDKGKAEVKPNANTLWAFDPAFVVHLTVDAIKNKGGIKELADHIEEKYKE